MPKPRRTRGTVRPRIETGRPSKRNLGGEVAQVAEDYLGTELYPWQRYAADRMTEVTAAGELRWREVVLTVARQQGKSTLMQAYALWRLLNAERFTEPQHVVTMAQTVQVARIVWEPAIARIHEQGLVTRLLRGAGFERAVLHDGSEWRILPGKLSAQTGHSVSLAIIDEAWNLDTQMYLEGIQRTQDARAYPQAVITSTAGSSSQRSLLSDRRELAQSGAAGILLLEWSAPPGADAGDEHAWRYANPHWLARRVRGRQASLERIRAARAQMDEHAFRSQILNQHGLTRDRSWLPQSVWDASQGRATAKVPGTTVIDMSIDGMSWVAARAVPVEGRIEVTAALSTAPLWAFAQDGDRVLVGASLGDMAAGNVKDDGLFGTREVIKYYAPARRAIMDRRVVFDVPEAVGEQVLAAVPSQRGGFSAGPRIEAARVVVVALGDVQRSDLSPLLV